MLVARVFALKQGEVEKEAYPLPQGAAFFAVAEIVAAHAPKLEEVRDKVRDDIVQETALEQARSLAASVKAKAAIAGLEKAAAAAGLVRKETPQLTGRGQPLGELGTGLALDEAAFSLPEKTLSDPVRTASGWAVLRVLEKKTADPADARQRARAGRGFAARAEALGALPGLPDRGARALPGHPQSEGVPARRRRAVLAGGAGGAMHVEVRQIQDVMILDLKGRLTAGLGDQILRDAIDELLAEDRKKILLNLSEVAFVDSAGIGELVAGLRTARRFGAELKLLNLGERVYSTLDMARLLPTFETYDEEGEAVRSFTGA